MEVLKFRSCSLHRSNLQSVDLLKPHMVNTLSCHFKIYDVEVYPFLTQEIMQALDNSDARSKRLSLHLTNGGQVEQDF